MMRIILLDEVCEICGINRELVLHFIEEEWVRPANSQSLEMDEEDLARIQLIRELKEEFGVNDEGMSIILPLLDQINRIHLEMDKLH